MQRSRPTVRREIATPMYQAEQFRDPLNQATLVSMLQAAALTDMDSLRIPVPFNMDITAVCEKISFNIAYSNQSAEFYAINCDWKNNVNVIVLKISHSSPSYESMVSVLQDIAFGGYDALSQDIQYDLNNVALKIYASRCQYQRELPPVKEKEAAPAPVKHPLVECTSYKVSTRYIVKNISESSDVNTVASMITYVICAANLANFLCVRADERYNGIIIECNDIKQSNDMFARLRLEYESHRYGCSIGDERNILLNLSNVNIKSNVSVSLQRNPHYTLTKLAQDFDQANLQEKMNIAIEIDYSANKINLIFSPQHAIDDFERLFKLVIVLQGERHSPSVASVTSMLTTDTDQSQQVCTPEQAEHIYPAAWTRFYSTSESHPESVQQHAYNPFRSL